MKIIFAIILSITALLKTELVLSNNSPTQIDSLISVLNNSKADTTKARLMNIIAAKLIFSDSQKAIEYANKALNLSIKNHNLVQQGAAFNTIGTSLYLRKELDSALYYYHKARKLFDLSNEKNRSTKSLMNIAVVYSEKSDYNKAIKYNQEALKLKISLKDSLDIATIYNNIGNCYNLMGDFNNAMTNFLQSVKIYEKIDDKNGLSTAYYNLSSLNYYKESYDIALQYCDQSLKIREEINNPYGIAYSLLLKGAIYERTKDYQSAIACFNKSLKIERELNDKQGIASILTNLSKVYQSQNKYELAKKMSLEALNICRETGIVRLESSILIDLAALESNSGNPKAALTYYNLSLELARKNGNKAEARDALSGLSEVYYQIKEYKNAYEYHRMFLLLKDSLFNEEKNKQLAEMDAKYQSEKKEKEIQLLNKNKELQKVEIEKKQVQVNKQRLIIFGFIGVFVIILIFSFIILRLYNQKKKANFILANKNEEILQKNEEITAQRDEIEAQRDEISNQHSIVTIQKEKIEEIHKEITDSIQYAKRIQRATLPKTETLKSHFTDSFLLFKPRDIVSGDFYWIAEVENHLIVTVADCTGHGVPGAFMSMLGMSILKEVVIKEYITHPSLILKRLRKEIINALQQKGEFGEQKDGMDMALISIDLSTNILQFAGANNPLYIVTNNELLELKGDKMPIAIHDNMEPYTTQEYSLKKGDCLYLLSDGFEDQFGGPYNKKYKSKPLKELLLKNYNLELEQQSEILETELNIWMGKEEQVDDITVLGIKI